MAKGLKMGAPAAPQAPAQGAPGKPMLDVSKMDIPGMLQKRLNISREEVAQLLQQLTKAKDPKQAAMIIKQFDRNPDTMNQPYNPAPAAPAAPAAQSAPAAGLQLGK